jgi:O2-independent ubiquinone biosynthesis accessory factor UbiT
MTQVDREQPGIGGAAQRVLRALPPPPLFLVQPLLSRVAQRVVTQYPAMLDRLGPHRMTRFLIDPTNLPFALLLQLDPARPVFEAVHRTDLPAHDARIAATILNLLRLVDQGQDGDAMFFSRDLDISGNTEAVVSLRNAIDDVDGSIVDTVADMFGPPGRAALAVVRKFTNQQPAERRAHDSP